MTVNFMLNGLTVSLITEANRRLLDLLRQDFHVTSVKGCCMTGLCGACSVFFNGSLAPSCMIPAFRVRGAQVLTLEGFARTEAYRDIAEGFAQAGVENCGYCDAGKILAAAALLEREPRPTREAALRAFQGVRCRCTEPESLAAGVLAAAELRSRRAS